MKSVAQVLYRRLRATSALAPVFSPSSLFASGEQGVWLDNSDFTTLFQDSAGTIPVTGYEQFVGLRLDKSKGLVLGNQLFTNADFDNSTTGWTASGGSTFTVSGGRANWSAASGSVFFFQNVSAAANKFYEMTVNVVSVTGTVRLVVNGGLGATSAPLTTGVTTVRLQNGSANGNAGLQADTAFSIVVESISIRELPGNHAYQTTTTARAVLSARYNQLTYTEQFDNAAWAKGGMTIAATGVSDPFGGLAATTIRGAITSSANQMYQSNTTVPVGVSTLFSIWVRRRTGSGTVRLKNQNGSDFTNITSSLTTSWQRFTITSVPNANGYFYPGITVETLNDEIDVYGADLRAANESSALPAYQRVGAAVNGSSTSIGTPDYDTVGFPAYLRYDGGDWYQTNSIDFTATDKMSVFAGVRKLSDGNSYGVVCELSTAWDSNNGTFSVLAPHVNADKGFSTGSRGTVSSEVTPKDYPAPVTTILTSLADISGDSLFFRINSLQVAQQLTNQGTGAYGNYPLYIGARAGNSLYYNGREYETIILGRAVTATELTNTEGYMEAQTFGKDMQYVYSDELTTSLGDLITAADGDQIYMTVTYQ